MFELPLFETVDGGQVDFEKDVTLVLKDASGNLVGSTVICLSELNVNKKGTCETWYLFFGWFY